MQAVVDTVKTAPPLAVGVLTIFGMPIDHVIQQLTVLWLVLLIAGWLYDRMKLARKRKATRRRNVRW